MPGVAGHIEAQTAVTGRELLASLDLSDLANSDPAHSLGINVCKSNSDPLSRFDEGLAAACPLRDAGGARGRASISELTRVVRWIWDKPGEGEHPLEAALSRGPRTQVPT